MQVVANITAILVVKLGKMKLCLLSPKNNLSFQGWLPSRQNSSLWIPKERKAINSPLRYQCSELWGGFNGLYWLVWGSSLITVRLTELPFEMSTKCRGCQAVIKFQNWIKWRLHQNLWCALGFFLKKRQCRSQKLSQFSITKFSMNVINTAGVISVGKISFLSELPPILHDWHSWTEKNPKPNNPPPPPTFPWGWFNQ